MSTIVDDLDDSSLFYKSLIQKRKPAGNGHPRNSKQLKLDFSQSSNKGNQFADNETEGNNKKTTAKTHYSKWDESSSSYFTKKSVNTCPLCLRSFKTDSSYSGHMKQCAKTHKMSTKQLLSALELQKKQMQERRDMGLCSQKASSPTKATYKKKKENDVQQYDLALGLALSKSLTGTDSKGITPPEVQKSTLEEFGFKSNNALVGSSRKVYKKSILKERTREERQRIIVEKVAVVLLDENKECSFKKRKLSLNVQNVQIPQLWNKGESNEKTNWYVKEIKNFLLSSEETPDEVDAPASPQERTTSTLPENIDSEISKLNLPQTKINEDWRKMINNSTLSDLTGKTKDSQNVFLHSLVLYARYPDVLEKDWEIIFEKFNLSTVVCFLEFLYCGTLNGLVRSEVDNLIDLTNELSHKELREVLNCLKNNLSGEQLSSPENEAKKMEITVVENKKFDGSEDKDLFGEEVVDITQEDDENETNVEKSYWSFLQHEKKRKELEGIQETEGEEKTSGNENPKKKEDEEETVSKHQPELWRMSEDSATKDLDDVMEKFAGSANSDCIIISSRSDSKTPENLEKSRTSSPVNVDYEVPFFDPYDNFHCFSEEPFSPVAIHSQSLITGDISLESPKLSTAPEKSRGEGREREGEDDTVQEEIKKKSFGYCSTPVTVRQSSKMNSTGNSVERSRRRKACDLSASRILRKSLNLHRRTKKRSKKDQKCQELAEALTSSILNELSKSSSTVNGFVEITPISNREEFVDNVTPSPNYSNMGESLLREQLTKYGLKKNLAKSKAKKILRHIYEELHPLYNTETGKIVKKLPGNTPNRKRAKSKPRKNDKPEKTEKNVLNSSVESALSEGGVLSLERLTDHDSVESDFENLNETLTQSMPCNPVDLPSAFCEFLQNNPEFHEKILLYEPIWLEELQRKLKETFKKHFKIADLMDFLDQKCITFRSEAQAKINQRRNGKKRENEKKKRAPAS